MRIPKSVKIGGHRFKLYGRTTRHINKLLKSEGVKSVHIGFYDPDKNVIYYPTDVARSAVEVTLLHEILHAIEDAGDVKLGEKKVGVLAEMLYQALHDNKLRF